MIAAGARMSRRESPTSGAHGHPVGIASIPRDWPNRDCSRIVEADGTRWHVQRAGSGPRLLLVHGTGASTHTWRDVLPLLAADYDVLAVDLPGHGHTSRLPGGAMTLPAIAGGLGALLQAEAFSPECVVGHSAGAAVLLAMALDGTIAPRAVVGLNAALRPFGGALHALVLPVARRLAGLPLLPYLLAQRAQDPAAVRRMLESTGSQLDEEGVALYRRLLQRRTHVAAVLAMMANWDLAPLTARLGDLEPPVFLVAADGDRSVRPGEARVVARRMPAAEVVELSGCGHLAHEEQPASVAALVRQLCCTGAATAAGGRLR
jgi:magnesium chelatase accessory protein